MQARADRMDHWDSSSRVLVLLVQALVLLLLLLEGGHAALQEDAQLVNEDRAAASLDASHGLQLLEGATQHWDHNYSCIFETGRTFTYLHIAYVTYFNITYKAPTYCSSDQCLDSCTNDCSCSAVVYDVSTSSCYQYHDYVPVQTIPFIPVQGRDTVTAYIKVQRGYAYSASSSLQDMAKSKLFLRMLASVGTALLWVVVIM